MRRALPILLVFAAAALLLLVHLGAEPLDEAEARSAIVARHILRTGQWLWPMPGKPFACEKSALVYWQSVPFAAGEFLLSRHKPFVSELAARLPSTLWALALLFLTWDLARRWHDGLTALLSAGALATSYGFLCFGRHGTAEMAQAATILWCLWYFVRHRADGNRRWLPALGLLLGIAASLGAREAYGVVVASVLVLSAMAMEWAWLRPGKTVAIAFLVSVVVFLALPLAASATTGSVEPLRALWREHVLRHLQPPGQAFGWHKDLARLATLCLPWLVLVPSAGLHGLWRGRRREAGSNPALLLGGAALAWLALSSSREPRHLLTVVPFVAVAAGRLLAQFSRQELGALAKRATQAVLVLGGVLVVSILVYSAVPASGSEGHWWVFVPGVLAGLALLACAFSRIGHAAPAAVAVLWLVHSTDSHLHWARGSDLRDRIAGVRRLGKPVAFVGHVPAPLAFYLDWTYSLLDDPADIQRWVTEREGGILIASRKPDGPLWQTVAEGIGWQAFTWDSHTGALSLTRDPAWLAKHPLRGLKSETLTYTFSAEAALRFNLGTVTMKLFHEDTRDGRQIVIAAESKGGVPGYTVESAIVSRLRENDLAQLEAHDVRTKPSYKHRRFVWTPEGVDYHRHDHCKGRGCRDPQHLVTRADGTRIHCSDKRCDKMEHRIWNLKEAFRQPGARDAWHVIAACYIARGFDLTPGAPPQRIRVLNNESMWDVAIRGIEERAIEVPAGQFQCVKVGFDATPISAEAKEAAEEAEGPFGLTGHADLYVDKATGVLVLLDGQVQMGATFKVQVTLTSRQAETR
ncbi:MAG TPA: glycosyltransferase family 39 protein [Planctomycetota bacterium]|nr:glycosyltransferase family 39 protein [Planctomycetota bacterium]HRR79092.1 glycosyltransferase family 39 protein [Planctomycetota bacterium]HRT93175.1 glycosyltransferase family 39 protein [Planctomycetota bacterium]